MTENSMGICYHCKQPGHWASQCPVATQQTSQTGRRGLGDDEIAWRILRFYQPAGETEMDGLIATWKQDYQPGVEYPEAPRYPPGFLALLQARARA